MKKAIPLLLALVMCLSLCACGNSNSNATNPPETQAPINEEPADETQAPANEEPEPPAKDTIYKLGDVIETDLFKITPTFTGFAYELAN